MKKQAHHYQAYLLRCWQETSTRKTDTMQHWRYAVEEIFGAQQRHGFDDLEAALEFIYTRITEAHLTAQEKDMQRTSGSATHPLLTKEVL